MPPESQQNSQTAGQVQAQPQGQAQGQPGAAQQQQQQQQAQEPKWFSYIPEAEREEVRKGWMMEGDYRKKTQTLAEEKKAWEAKQREYETRVNEYEEFKKKYIPFQEKLRANWGKIEPILSGQVDAQQQVQQQQVQQQSQQTTDVFRDFDLLPPAEQAKRIADHVIQNGLQAQLAALENKFTQAINQAVNPRWDYAQNYLNIFTDAIARKFENPQLNLQSFLDNAVKLKYGQGFDPLQIAYQLTTADQTQKTNEEQWYNKGKEDAKLELQNQQQSNGAMQQPFIPIFKQKPLSREQIREQVRNEAAQKGITWG